MKTSMYSDPLILSILRQTEGGVPVAELCREHGMSNTKASGVWLTELARRGDDLIRCV